MTYNFYADRKDKLELLEFIFNETDLRVFDLSSLPGKRIWEYTSAKEIDEKFDLKNGGSNSATFQLWTSRYKGDILFRKIELDPKYSKEYNYRYSTEGWGLIQLYFGGLKNGNLYYSHIGHFNEKGAQNWESTNAFNGKVASWDWKEIEKSSRALKYQIQKKMSVSKIGSTDVMADAEILKNSDVSFL
jgi:hypothetical protein